jgi:ABC-type bacteriocin/lantibiotic exporter with double-glycine peptidase domain
MIIDFPCGRQTFDYDCGAKSLQMVLAYYGLDVREDGLIVKLNSGDHGTYVKDIEAVARDLGFKVTVAGAGTAEIIRRYIDARQPVIVLLQAWSEHKMTAAEWAATNQHGHYVVVIGYEDDRFIFADPSSFPRCWLTETEFIARWHFTTPDGKISLDRYYIVLQGREPVDFKGMVHMD